MEVTELNLTTDQLYLLILEQQLQNAELYERRCARRANEADVALQDAMSETVRLTTEIEFRRAEMLKRRCV